MMYRTPAYMLAVALVVTLIVLGIRDIKHQGALELLTRQDKAQLDTVRKAAQVQADSFASATERGDQERRLLRQHQALDHADSAKLQRTVVALASARDAALAVLADSLASAARLRETLAHQLAASDSTEQAHAVVERGLRSRLAEALAQVVRDSVNLTLGARSLQTQQAATAAAVTLANDYKRQIPSTWWRLGQLALAIEGGRLSAGAHP